MAGSNAGGPFTGLAGVNGSVSGAAAACADAGECMDLDAYARDWAALRRAALEDYRLLPRHLHALQERIGRQFDFDCCCNDDGSNAHAPRFASPSRSFLDQGTDIRGMCVWMNAPFSMLGAFIAAYVERKRLDPSTCGCILVPKWAGPWRKLMRGMQLVAEYPVGTVLFDKPCGEDFFFFYILPLGFHPWADRDRDRGQEHLQLTAFGVGVHCIILCTVRAG